MNLTLTSGETALIEIIPRARAIDILSQPAFRRTWFGRKYKAPHRVSRGPGPAGDLVNYGLLVAGKCRAVARIGLAPWGNQPVIAAVGIDLAPYTAYLSRLWGAGISAGDLVEFLRAVNLRFPADMQRRRPDRPPFRYLLSLDSINGWIIDHPRCGLLEASPVAGRVYHRAGALYAGQTRRHTQPTRYIDAQGTIRSTYQSGHNRVTELRRKNVDLIYDGPKHRFVFILGCQPDSLEYAAYRVALPPNVQEFKWGEFGLGWIQPRLFFTLIKWLHNGREYAKEKLRCEQFKLIWPSSPGRN